MTDQAVSDPSGSAVTPSEANEQGLYRSFNRSVVISGIRCTLTYVVLPYLAPLIGLSGSVGPALGLVVGVVAVVANIYTIRRFWSADHRWKKPVTAISAAVILLLVVLAVRDLQDLLG